MSSSGASSGMSSGASSGDVVGGEFGHVLGRQFGHVLGRIVRRGQFGRRFVGRGRVQWRRIERPGRLGSRRLRPWRFWAGRVGPWGKRAGWFWPRRLGTRFQLRAGGTPVRAGLGPDRADRALKPGDRVAALDVAGLDRDVPWRAQYQWLRQRAEAVLTPVTGSVASVKVGTHDGFITINGRLRLTPEHPVLLKRGDEVGFVSAEFVLVGDYLVRHDLSEERVETARARAIASPRSRCMCPA
jgi:hypothetical protein